MGTKILYGLFVRNRLEMSQYMSFDGPDPCKPELFETEEQAKAKAQDRHHVREVIVKWDD